MTDTYADLVYDVLVVKAGATESQRQQFVATWPKCNEYRFMGSLGFGGKVWAPKHGRPAAVSCYREDESPERLAVIEDVNQLLALLEDEPWEVSKAETDA